MHEGQSHENGFVVTNTKNRWYCPDERRIEESLNQGYVADLSQDFQIERDMIYGSTALDRIPEVWERRLGCETAIFHCKK